jgi:hypothetical protein
MSFPLPSKLTTTIPEVKRTSSTVTYLDASTVTDFSATVGDGGMVGDGPCRWPMLDSGAGWSGASQCLERRFAQIDNFGAGNSGASAVGGTFRIRDASGNLLAVDECLR